MDRQSRLADITQAVLALAAVALMIWEETPQWQRELVQARVRRSAIRWFGRLARRSGDLAMRDELRNRPAIAEWRYRVTCKLSELRDLL